jgi:glutamine synthetase
MGDPSESDQKSVETRVRDLQSAGVRLVIGSIVNASGVTLAKCVPVARLPVFHRSGMGASPVWDVFTPDGNIAFTKDITAVGDWRLRIDPAAVRVISDGLAWAPANVYSQDGEPVPNCSRTLLGSIEQRLETAGLQALIGHELEFVLVAPDRSMLDSPSWVPYGVTGLLEQGEFLSDLVTSSAAAGAGIEQVHAEYGRNQFELSLSPASPVAAADSVVLSKIIVGMVARRHGVRASFSPAPFPGTVGNGAHQHFSLARNGQPLFESGSGPYGITDDGGAAIAGILNGIGDLQGMLTGSILSGARLAPGTWSGAFVCWGYENREASVRFLASGVSNPYGGNVEVKPVDPSANVYLASSAILALALHGIENGATLPPEVPVDPNTLSEEERRNRGIHVLTGDPVSMIGTLEASELARELLGDDIVDATVAVRRLEQSTFADIEINEVAQQLRLAWSI